MAVDSGSVYSSIRIRLDQLDNDLKGVFARLSQLETHVASTTTKSQNAFQRFFSFIKSSGILPVASLTAAFALLKNVITGSESAWEAQTVAVAKLNSVLKSTGADSWISSEALTDMASSLQKVTLYGDETISSMQAVLLGFRSIRGDNFEEATKAILDMSTVMGQDLATTAQQVGKALDLLDWNALSKQGFRFTEQQKAAGEAMKAAGDLAGAQKIILDELNLAFGGAAAAAASASNGNIQLQNAVGDVNEEIGRALASGFKPMRVAFIGIAEAVGAAIKKANDYRDAVEATKAGNATIDQRLKLLNEELAIREANLRILLQSGDEALQVAASSASQEKVAIDALKAERSMLAEQARYAGLAEAAAKKAAETQAVSDDIAAAKAAVASEIQNKRVELYDKYKAAVAAANDLAARGYITQEEREARIRSAIEAEIEGLEALKAEYKITDSAATTIRIDEQIAKLKEMRDEETYLNNTREASLATAEEVRAANADLYVLNKENNAELAKRNKGEVDLLEQMRQEKIAAIEASDADQKYKDRAIQSTNELYKALKNDAAWNEFAANADKAFSAFSNVFSALSDLVTQMANNNADAQLAALEKVQEAQQEALEEKYDALEEALDAELQAKLYEAGLAEAATVEQLENELAKAKETGDAETIAEAEKALEKAKIEEEYDKKQEELAKQRAATEKALEEQQAKDKAEIQYKAEMTAWKMKVISAVANAAQAVVGALSAPPFWPWNAAFVATSAAAGALQVAAVRAAKPVLAYATGGIVPGTRTTTDSVPVILRPREAVLTEAQQAEFMWLANGGGGGGSAQAQIIEIPVYLDGLMIAKSTAQIVSDGKVLIKARGIR
ncbi:MAG: hypothetical protein WC378_16360 [Opitutaceae bacterium]|jgi:hypothetical protein